MPTLHRTVGPSVLHKLRSWYRTAWGQACPLTDEEIRAIWVRHRVSAKHGPATRAAFGAAFVEITETAQGAPVQLESFDNPTD